MPAYLRYFLLITLLCRSPWAIATTIHRCEATNGHITFTTHSCSPDESRSIQDVRTYTPNNDFITFMPGPETRQIPDRNIKRSEPTIVGKSEDGCGNLISARERREAIINQRVVAGMSLQDVESALGKPDKISIRNSSTSYRYETKRGRSAHIEFDERGCTKGKAKSQTAKSPH
ncbi:hypothetical protein D3C84_822650 [compost metagenome]